MNGVNMNNLIVDNSIEGEYISKNDFIGNQNLKFFDIKYNLPLKMPEYILSIKSDTDWNK